MTYFTLHFVNGTFKVHTSLAKGDKNIYVAIKKICARNVCMSVKTRRVCDMSVFAAACDRTDLHFLYKNTEDGHTGKS